MTGMVGNDYRKMADEIMEEEDAPYGSNYGNDNRPSHANAKTPNEWTPEKLNRRLQQMVNEEWLPAEIDELMKMTPEQVEAAFRAVEKYDFMEHPFEHVPGFNKSKRGRSQQLEDQQLQDFKNELQR